MQTARKIIFPLTILFIMSLCLFLSILPDIYHASVTPKDVTFPLVHNSPEDYFYYLSLMRQGYDGHLKITSRMTVENFPPMLVQTLFSLLGMIAKGTGISLVHMYFLARIFFGGSLLVAVYLTIRTITPLKIYRIISLLLVSFSTGFWIVSKDQTLPSVTQYLTYWTRLDPVLRTTYLPHHVASTMFGVVSLLFLWKGIKKGSFPKILVASFLGFLSGYIYFATVVNILGGIFIGITLFLFVHLKEKNFVHWIQKQRINFGFILIYVVSTLLSLLILLSVSKSVFPWSNYSNLEREFTFSISLSDYIKSLGPTFILTVLGLPLIFFSGNLFTFILLGWGLFPFIGIFFISTRFPSYGNVYFLEATSYIPFGILSVYGYYFIKQAIPLKYISAILTGILLIYFIPPMISSVQTENKRLSPTRYNVYLPNEVMDGMAWLDKHSAPESVVISGGYFGIIIPAFTSNRVVNGHPKNTYNPAEKTRDILTFFATQDTNEAKNILVRNRVSYVFYSFDTDLPQKAFIDNLPFEKVFGATRVFVYKVRPELNLK